LLSATRLHTHTKQQAKLKNILHTRKQSKVNGLVTPCVGTAFRKALFNEKWKGREDEEDDISSYKMTLRKMEDTVRLKRKHQKPLCRDLALEEAIYVS
jgi:hypothetical protein